MKVRGSRVGIVGGSIAGCAAAIALGRLGCEVEVFERSAGGLQDRGSGIGIPAVLDQELKDAGYLPEEHDTLPMTHREWLIVDGSLGGRRLWLQKTGEGRANNWGLLWKALRARVDDDVYRSGVAVTDVVSEADGVAVLLSDGTNRRFDFLVAADGYRSAIRSRLMASTPAFAGYILWRGNYPESRIDETPAFQRVKQLEGWSTVCFPGGHGVYYPIPDVDGGRRVNWAIYAKKPDELEITGPSSIPPGGVTTALYAHLDTLLAECFPPDQAALVRASPVDEVSIQPIYDEVVDRYVHGRVVLIGDAGSVTRPHTGSGATKALRDARCLELLGAEHTDLDELLAAYDAARVGECRTLVEVGQRIGRAQVDQTPDWAAMGPAEFEAWTAATLAGDSLYLYGEE